MRILYWWLPGPKGVIVCRPVHDVTDTEACALPNAVRDCDGFSLNFVLAAHTNRKEA